MVKQFFESDEAYEEYLELEKTSSKVNWEITQTGKLLDKEINLWQMIKKLINPGGKNGKL